MQLHNGDSKKLQLIGLKINNWKQDLSKVAEEEAKALYESKLQSILNNANTAEDKYKALSLYGMEESQIAKILEQEGKAVGDAWKQTSIGSAALRKLLTYINLEQKIKQIRC